MKNKMIRHGAVLMAAMLAVTMVGCGSGASGEENGGKEEKVQTTEKADKTSADADFSKNAGKYTIFQMTTADTPVGLETLGVMGMGDSYVRFDADGTGEMKLGEDGFSIALDKKGKVTVEGTPMYDYELKEDVLTISLGTSLTYTFVRDGADAASALDKADVEAVTDVIAVAQAEYDEQMEEAMNAWKSVMQVWEDSEAQREADIAEYQKGKVQEEAGIPYYYDSTYPDDKSSEQAVAKDEMDDFSIFYYDSPFYERLVQNRPTGDAREDMLAIARSQIGYCEGNWYGDVSGLNAFGDDDFTEFGKYHGSIGTAWCSEFASWCVRMTGIPFNRISTSRCACANNFTNNTTASYHGWDDTVYAGGSFEPKGGEIVFWEFGDDPIAPDEALSHTSIIESVVDMGDNIIIHVIEGNTGNRVAESDYVLNKDGSLVDGGKLGYIIAPDYDSENATIEISFDANGRSLNWDSKTAFVGGLYGVLPKPEGSGSFAGWYTEAAGGEKITPYSQVTAATAITLYAHYE